MAEHEEEHHGSDGRKHQAHCHVELLARGHIQHDDEHQEQHERAAQILFQHNDEEGQRPHEQQRQKRLQAGQVNRAHAPCEHGEHLAILRQIGRQEKHDEYLRQFARLEGKTGDGQPQAAAVDLGADPGKHRRKQQQHTDDHERVLVIGKPVQVAHQHEHQHQGGHTREHPDELAACGGRSQARDECDADARKRESDGKQRRVSVGGKLANGKMRQQERHEYTDGDHQRVEAERTQAFLFGASPTEHHHGEHDDD